MSRLDEQQLAGSPAEAARPGAAAARVAGLPDDRRGSRIRGVVAVVPCFNQPEEARRAAAGLGEIARRLAARDGAGAGGVGGGGGLRLRSILVDNGSDAPLIGDGGGMEGVEGGVEVLRLARNAGGSGGFNAGIARALATGDESLVWLVDSDAAVTVETLLGLVRALDARPEAVAAGPGLRDPRTGRTYETGGRVNRRTGRLGPAGSPHEVDYVASCCALVRRSAIEHGGLMPDLFLNGDDASWMVLLSREGHGPVVGAPGCFAEHPSFDGFKTWQRYYAARNALAVVDAMGLPRRVRAVRWLIESARAAQQRLMGRPDLARLHIRGMGDGLRGRLVGPGAGSALPLERPAGWEEAAGCGEGGAVVIEGGRMGAGPVFRAAWRLVAGPRARLARVPARGGADAWFAGRRTVAEQPGGFVARGWGVGRRWGAVLGALWTFVRGAGLALRAWARPRGFFLPERGRVERRAEAGRVGVAVLSYKRPEVLRATLGALFADGALAARMSDEPSADQPAVVVCDNASGDGSAETIAGEFPNVTVVPLAQNIGVEAFNVAVGRLDGCEYALVLDDDARPEPGAVARAAELLDADPGLGAVTLHPKHPATGESEWPFAEVARRDPGGWSRAWPVMGCANLVRVSAWIAAGGYERGFFLYRNDTDLALTMLDLGVGVGFDPDLVAWHDSPSRPGEAKSVRWHRLATRNWIWMARRHGSGAGWIVPAMMGWLWAHKLAGRSGARHAATVRGGLAGFIRRAPGSAARGGARRRGDSIGRLIRLRRAGR